MCNMNRAKHSTLLLYLNLIMQRNRNVPLYTIYIHTIRPVLLWALPYTRSSVNRNVPEIERVCCQSHHNLKKNTTWTAHIYLVAEVIYFTKRINANTKLHVYGWDTLLCGCRHASHRVPLNMLFHQSWNYCLNVACKNEQVSCVCVEAACRASYT